jgi:aspartyl-tRNA(Asn)/glutamyl-tRNA(Gln) amidotransferase subunit A
MKTALEISEAVRSGKVSAEEVAKQYLAKIAQGDSQVKAFVTVLEKEALAQARAVDEKRRKGEALGALAGVPVAVKDNIMVEGIKTTCSSKILENYVAPYDGAVTQKLKEADAVIVGKTNLDEFAMGSSTENSAFFKTRNPWNLDCVPGGSSGGSAAAVAAGFAPISLGSDTGGSIRQPASHCGVVGMKPTYGLVSRFGLVAFASSLDQIGPFSYTTEDAALALEVLAGHDGRDSTSAARQPENYRSALKKGVAGLKIGLPKEYFIPGMDPEVEKAVRAAVAELEKQGARISEVSLPHTQYAVSTYYIIAPSEASSNLARFDGIRYGFRSSKAESLEEVYEASRGEGFGPEVKRRIMLGTYALSSGYYDAYYGRAQRVRTLIKKDFDDAFAQVDVIATPTAPSPAFRFGEKSADPLAMYLSDIFTIPCNLAGIPGLTLPCGKSSRGLPIGLQLLAPAFAESSLFAASAAYEKTHPFARLESLK